MDIKTAIKIINDKRAVYGIPSRNDVQPGTKGSYDFVIDNMGLEWARKMEEA